MFHLCNSNLDAKNNAAVPDSFDLAFDFDEWINGTAELLRPFHEAAVDKTTKNREDCSSSSSAAKNCSDSSENNCGDGNSSPNGAKNRDHKPKSSEKSRSGGTMQRINQLGRVYACGRPLSIEVREAICDLHRGGSKPCEIAAVLNVTHGCVSKIVKRYQTTGTAAARKIGGSYPSKSLPTVVNAIIKYKTEQPTIRAWEVRERLITDALCELSTLPTTSSINRIVRQNLGRFFSRNSKQNKLATCMNKNRSIKEDIDNDDRSSIAWNNYQKSVSCVSLESYADHYGSCPHISVSDSSIDESCTPSPSLFGNSNYSSTESVDSITSLVTSLVKSAPNFGANFKPIDLHIQSSTVHPRETLDNVPA